MKIQDDRPFTIYEKELNNIKYYRLQLSKKLQDGNYQNGYVDIKFVKCEPPSNRERIYLKNAWWSFYLSKDKHTIPYIVCMEYEHMEDVIKHSKENDIVKENIKEEPTSINFKEIEIEDELLPF